MSVDEGQFHVHRSLLSIVNCQLSVWSGLVWSGLVCRTISGSLAVSSGPGQLFAISISFSPLCEVLRWCTSTYLRGNHNTYSKWGCMLLHRFLIQRCRERMEHTCDHHHHTTAHTRYPSFAVLLRNREAEGGVRRASMKSQTKEEPMKSR